MKSGQTVDALLKKLWPISAYILWHQTTGKLSLSKTWQGAWYGVSYFQTTPNLGLRLYVNASWQVDNIPDMTVEPDTVYMHVGCVSKHGVECVGRISEVVVDRQSLILELFRLGCPWQYFRQFHVETCS